MISRELDYSVSVGDEMRGIKGNKHPELTKLTHWYSGKEKVKPDGHHSMVNEGKKVIQTADMGS